MRASDRMRGAVKRGPHEVVHSAIHDHEGSSSIFFGVKHAHQHDAGRANQRASRLNQQMASQRTNRAGQFGGVRGLFRRLLRGISDAEPSTAIEIAQRNSFALEVADKSSQTS